MLTELADPEVAAVLDRFRTTEFATLTKDGTPVAWPAAPLFVPDRGQFVLTTSIGLPRKAYNIRRDPRVALHFSDPTASGLTGAPRVLVQGEARVSEEIVTSPAGIEEWWTRVYERQPVNRNYGRNALTRRAMDWYYMRLVITVTPTAVHTGPALPDAVWAPPPVQGDRGDPFVRTVRGFRGFSSAVLAGRDDQGAPWLTRVRPEPDTATRSLRISVGEDERIRPGRASVLCHSHDEHLWHLRSAAVLGTLDGGGTEWTFRPERVLGSGGGALGAVRAFRDVKRSSSGYLRRRGLTPPAIPWAEYEPLKAEAVRREGAGSRA
jgi:hypothetical protein